MASVAFFKERVEGKQKELDRLQKKLERIQTAAASDWEINPYSYSEYDLRRTEQDIEKARAALDNYTAQLRAEAEKENSRNVLAILSFLEEWKSRCMTFYRDSLSGYLSERDAWLKKDREFCEWRNKERRQAHEKEREAFQDKWRFIVPYTTYEGGSLILDVEKLDRVLTEEAKAKYDFIVKRVTAITGQITDASGLSVAANGELNGYIKGRDGTAKVNTIGAGGYNIQRFHFRTLITKV